MANSSVKAAVFHRAGERLQITDFPEPVAQANEAVAKIDLCTICGSDLHTIQGKRSEPTPVILGHEILGTITQVGTPPLTDLDGEPLAVGDRVTWSVCISCQQCERCRSGFSQKCLNVRKYGHVVAEGRTALQGGLAEAAPLLSAGTSVVKVGPSIPEQVICPVNCATATVAAAFRVAGPVSGKRVLVVGAGMLGLTAIAFAKTGNARRIDVCDINQERLETARKFGADELHHWQVEPANARPDSKPLAGDADQYDVLLEFSGSAEAVKRVFQLGDIGAKTVLVGSVMRSPPVAIDPERIVRNWLSIHGVHNYGPDDLVTAVDFLQNHGNDFPFESLVEKTFGLDDVSLAIDYALNQRSVRVGIRP